MMPKPRFLEHEPERPSKRAATGPPPPENAHLDPGMYGFKNDNDVLSLPLSWSLEPSDDLSDWKIIINRTTDTAAPARTYYVHKVVLAAGPRKSNYFLALFKNELKMKETTTSTSTITLEDSGADVFPTMLDYFYSTDGNIDVKTKNAVVLRNLAQYFQMHDLFMKLTDFISNDLGPKTSLEYLRNARAFSDEHLETAVIKVLAKHLEEIDVEDLLSLSPEIMKCIFSSKDLNCNSESLSKIALAYCEALPGGVGKELFLIMTSSKIMPVLDPSAGLGLAKVYTDLEENASDEEEPESDSKDIMMRCGKALWSSQELLGENDTQSKEQRDQLRALPQSSQIDILEASLDAAKANIRRAIVHGAGAEAINGIYSHTGYYNGARKYEKDCILSCKKKVTFTLLKCGTFNGPRWFISIASSERPGTDADMDFYSCGHAEATEDGIPPKSGWCCGEFGKKPEPVVLTLLY